MILVPIQYNDRSYSPWTDEDWNPPTLEELDELEREIEKRREELLKEAENDKQE